MCDVPSRAVFCSESIESFPGTASKFFLKLLVTIPVVPIITGRIVHIRFHIRCISMHKLLYYYYYYYYYYYTPTCNSLTRASIWKHGARKFVTFFSVRHNPLRTKYQVHQYSQNGRRCSDDIYNALIISSHFKSDF